MNANMTRSGDIISLDNAHHDLLTSMSGETVPETMTVTQAKELLARIRKVPVDYPEMRDAFLANVEAMYP